MKSADNMFDKHRYRFTISVSSQPIIFADTTPIPLRRSFRHILAIAVLIVRKITKPRLTVMPRPGIGCGCARKLVGDLTREVHEVVVGLT